ncbi:MAG TPA: tetratricopeptide repeat protein [Bacteroidales bacterium]|nr:tetratricopeptide repeat protein [Bacteroidales bacterium]
MKTKILIIFLFVFVGYNVLGQSKNNPDSLVMVYEIKQNSLNYREKAQELSKIGNSYYQNQNYAKSIFYKKQTLDIYRQLNDKPNQFEILEQLGVLYSIISNYNESLNYLIEALKISRAIGDVEKEYAVLLNIGTTHIEATNYKKGLDYLIKCKEYYEQAPEQNYEYKFAVYTNLGVVYQYFSESDSAQFYYLKALEICKESEQPNVAGVLINLADLYVVKDSLDIAEKYYIQAGEKFMKANDMLGYWHTKYAMARLSLVRGHYSEALNKYLDLIETFTEVSDLAYLSMTYKDLSVVYQNLNNDRQALECFKEHTSIKDSIASGDILIKMEQLEMQYEIDRLEKENELNLKIMNKEKTLIILRWYIISGILFIILLFVILLLTRHRIKKRLLEVELKNSHLEQNLLEEEVDYHKKELENFALHIVHKNNLLLTLKNELSELKGIEGAEKISKIKSLSSTINQALKLSNDVEKLQQRIDEVHSQFLKKLHNRFPSLTEKDKRLCVMLKLDLSSKEISVLNNISEHAIMMARYRLRRKMGINAEDNLVDFLQKI